MERTAEEEFEHLKNRPISQITYLKCAECGGETMISNRYKSNTLTVSALDNGLFRINFVCSHNGCTYDMYTCGSTI